MMRIVKRTAASQKDFIDIWKFIAADGKPDAASNLLDEFDAALLMLAEHPMAGSARHDLRPSLRSFPVASYLLFYEPIRNGIRLARVLHGARDIERIFRR